MSQTTDYWKKRAEKTLVASEKVGTDYEKLMIKSYKQTISNIKKELSAFYGKYATKEGITLAQAKKRLNPKELGSFKQNLDTYMQEVEKLKSEDLSQHLNHLEKLSARAYVARLDELMTNIDHELALRANGQVEGLGQTMQEAYQEGFFRKVFDVQQQAGFGVSFTKPGKEQLDKAIKEKWLGDNYSERIWKNKKRLVDTLTTVLSQQFVRGSNLQEAATEIVSKLNVDLSSAIRLVRTEVNYIANKGAIDGYKASGITDHYEFLATLDNRTSKICADLDGKVFEVKDAVAGINLPPMHPYCRSTTIPYFEEEVIEDRVAKDEDGKTYKVGKDLTFKEWSDKYCNPEIIEKPDLSGKLESKLELPKEEPKSKKTIDKAKSFSISNYKLLSQDEAVEEATKAFLDEESGRMPLPAAYLKYIGHGYRDMNTSLIDGTYERYKKDPMSFDSIRRDYIADTVKSVDELKSFISSAPNLKKNTKLVRFSKKEEILNLLSQIMGEEAAESLIWDITKICQDPSIPDYQRDAVEQAFAAKVGKNEIRVDSFLSTSYKANKNPFKNRDYEFTIYADKGCNTLITENFGESEIIFHPGQKLQILGLKIEEKIRIELRAMP